MTNIAIYKPYKTVYWKNWALDINVYGREIINLSKLLADRGHKVYLCSNTDYDNSYNNIEKSSLDEMTDIDVFVIFNGAFSKNSLTEKQVVEIARQKKIPKVILIASDLNLTLEEHDLSLYDKVLTTTKKQLSDKTNNCVYAACENYHMYKEEIYDGGWEVRKHYGIFVGHDRHKEKLFFEYVWRPGIDFFGKFEALNVNKKILRDKAYNLLREYTYSIVFFNKEVTDLNFVTARPLELELFGIIPFIDKEYDKDNLQFEKNDERRVNNYIEFYNKTQNMGKQEFLKLQQKGFEHIKKIISGDQCYDLFMRYVLE